MKVVTKIFQVINFLFFALCLLALFTIAGAIVTMLTTSIGIMIFFLPILIGFVLTVFQLLKAKKENTRLTKKEKFLAVFPIINFSVICILIVLSYF